jgi:RES domain-containing protein
LLRVSSCRIDCSDILDLTTDEGLAASLITRAELACAWEMLAADRKPVPTWELADRLIKSGCVGIIVPSFAARAGERDINLVLWHWTQDKPYMVIVDDDNRLPKDRSSGQ